MSGWRVGAASPKEGWLTGQGQTGTGPEGPCASGERPRASTYTQKKDVAWLSHVCDGQGIRLQEGRMSFQGYVAY